MNEQIRKINSLGLVISLFCVSQSALEHSPLHATPLLHLPPIPKGINHTFQNQTPLEQNNNIIKLLLHQLRNEPEPKPVNIICREILVAYSFQEIVCSY